MINIINAIATLLAPILAAILVIFFKEFSKIVACVILGDNSLKISINPFKYIEPIGLILLISFGTLGWGKPVETNHYRYKNPRNAVIISSLVPMIMLILLGILGIFLLSIITAPSEIQIFLNDFLFSIIRFSFGLFVFNLVPIYPFEASRILKLFMPPNQALSFNANERLYLFVLTLLFLIIPGALNGVFLGLANNIMLFFINLIAF